MKLSISDLELGDIIRTEGEYAPDWRVLIRASERGADPGMLRFRFQRVLATSGEFVDVAEDAEFPPGTEFDVVYRARAHSAPEPEPLSPHDMSDLQDVAEKLVGVADATEIRTGWDVYDGARSSSGQEYVLSPRSAGWHTLVEGRVLRVTVEFEQQPDVVHDVRMELDESYALRHADDPENWQTEEALRRADAAAVLDDDLDEIPGACDITGQ